MPAQSPPVTTTANGAVAALSGLFRPYEMLNSFMMSNLLMNSRTAAAARSLDPGFVPKDDLEEEEEEEEKTEIDVD